MLNPFNSFVIFLSLVGFSFSAEASRRNAPRSSHSIFHQLHKIGKTVQDAKDQKSAAKIEAKQREEKTRAGARETAMNEAIRRFQSDPKQEALAQFLRDNRNPLFSMKPDDIDSLLHVLSANTVTLHMGQVTRPPLTMGRIGSPRRQPEPIATPAFVLEGRFETRAEKRGSIPRARTIAIGESSSISRNLEIFMDIGGSLNEGPPPARAWIFEGTDGTTRYVR